MIGTLRLFLILLVVALVTLPLALYQSVAVKTGWLSDRWVPRFFHRLVVKLLGLRIHVIGAVSAQRPLLIASNHVSWLDIVVLGSLTELHFIAKSEVAGWPVIGFFARMQRSVFIERTAKRKSEQQASEIAGRLRSGDPMVLFAEGTSSDGNLIQPFKSTLFAAAQMALEGAGGIVHIQPVALAYTRIHGIPMGRLHRSHAAWLGDQDLVPHLAALVREGAVDVEVHLGEPLSFAPGDNRKEAARAVEGRVRDMMAAALRDPKRSR